MGSKLSGINSFSNTAFISLSLKNAGIGFFVFGKIIFNVGF
jgi:hypothetical protein